MDFYYYCFTYWALISSVIDHDTEYKISLDLFLFLKPLQCISLSGVPQGGEEWWLQCSSKLLSHVTNLAKLLFCHWKYGSFQLENGK